MTVSAPPSEPDTFVLPARPRRRVGGRALAAVAALLLVAVGFLAGVQVEKSNVTTTSTTASAAGGFRSALAGGTARSGAGAATGAGAAAGAAAGGGFARSFGAGGAGGSASFGTIGSISGHAVYLTTASGNTVKVVLTPSTKLTKSQSVSRSALRPGDTIIVQGITGSGGDITAASVSDSGARTTGTTSSSSRSAPSSAGAAVNSLFGSSSGR
jgi:hypothetical protein